MLQYYLNKIFPFSNSGIMEIGVYLAPSIYIIGSIALFIMAIRSSYKPYSLLFFLAFTILSYLLYLAGLLVVMAGYLWIILSPYFVVVFLLCSITSIIEIHKRKIAKSCILQSILMFLVTLFYYYFNVSFSIISSI